MLSYEEQMNAIAAILREEIHQLDTLPRAEAKKMAHEGLVKVGIIDDDGNLTAPYAALKELSM